MSVFEYFKFLSILICLINLLKIVNSLQCYYCEDETYCNQLFDPQNQTFIQNCPSAKSCSIQTSGGHVIKRSCESIQLEDCQTANNIRYCYCTQYLCNQQIIDHHINKNNNDDEDLTDDDEEGSGINSNEIGRKKDARKKINQLSPSSKNQSDFNQTVIFIAFTILFSY